MSCPVIHHLRFLPVLCRALHQPSPLSSCVTPAPHPSRCIIPRPQPLSSLSSAPRKLFCHIQYFQVFSVRAVVRAVPHPPSPIMLFLTRFGCFVQDITANDAVEELCGAHQADLVTFSYSLSMIPKQARRLLSFCSLFIIRKWAGHLLLHKRTSDDKQKIEKMRYKVLLFLLRA